MMKPYKDITDPRMIKALAHPMRMRILATLDQKVASPSELAGELDAPIGNVSYHVRILDSLGLIRLVRTTPKRGAIEHHYEAVVRPIITDDTWASVPESVKHAVVGSLLDQVGRQVTSASVSGGFDRPEAHLGQMALVLDREGWDELSQELLKAREYILEIGRAAETRLKDRDEQGDPAVFLIMFFEAMIGADAGLVTRPRRRTRRSTARA
jgi:DNA-binding transcriptional ArsR family regulator